MSAEPAAAGGWAWPSDETLVAIGRVAAAVGAAVLAGTGTGSATVAALLLGVAVADRRTGAAAVLAVLATGIRWRTDAFDDLAGIQGVLGLAGEVGPATAAASAWLAAAAVVLACGPLPPAGSARGWVRLVPALPAGLLAAALVAGPGPESLAVRLLAGAAGVGLATGVALLDLRAGSERADRRVGVAGGHERADRRERPAATTARRWLAVGAGLAACVLAGWPA